MPAPLLNLSSSYWDSGFTPRLGGTAFSGWFLLSSLACSILLGSVADCATHFPRNRNVWALRSELSPDDHLWGIDWSPGCKEKGFAVISWEVAGLWH